MSSHQKYFCAKFRNYVVDPNRCVGASPLIKLLNIRNTRFDNPCTFSCQCFLSHPLTLLLNYIMYFHAIEPWLMFFFCFVCFHVIFLACELCVSASLSLHPRTWSLAYVCNRFYLILINRCVIYDNWYQPWINSSKEAYLAFKYEYFRCYHEQNKQTRTSRLACALLVLVHLHGAVLQGRHFLPLLFKTGCRHLT